MAEDQTQGKRFSLQSGGRLGARIGNQGATQTQGSTQSTGASDTSGVQSSGVFLPGISGVNNKVAPTNDFISGIQSGKIQSNIQLPGITTKPENTDAVITGTTKEQQRKANIRADNNGVDKQSWNEKIENERYSSQTLPLLQQGVKQTWNDIKKFSYRKGMDFVENPGKYLSQYIPGGILYKYFLNNMGSPVSQEKINDMWNNYYQYEDKINKSFDKWVENNIDQEIAQKYAEKGLFTSLKEGDWNNAKYGIKQAFSTSILPMLPGMVAGILTKNPAVLAGVGFLPSKAVEDQEAYDEALKLGASREQATSIGQTAGNINGVLEIVGEFTQLKGLLKPLKKNITKEITKKTTKQIIGRGLLDLGKGIVGEGSTEGLQELVTNALIKTVDENRDLFEGVLDSIIAGGIIGAPGSTLGAGGKIAQDVENNKIIDQKTDLEALDYVLEGEKRKAQRIEQQKEKMRQRANAVKNPTLDNGYTPIQEEAEQRAKENEEREQFEQERDDEYNREMQIENDMMNEVLSEGDLNEDLGDPRYQKSDSPQSVSEDTVREKSRTGNVSISSENSSEISKNLNEIKKNLEDLKADTFLQQIKKSISGDEKNSNYITNRINGNKYVLRIADHHANAKNSKKSPYNNTSIVIKLVKRKNNGKNIQFKKYKSVDMMEFVYNPENMTTEKMQGIIDGIQNWIKTGEYTDTNYDSKNQSTRKIGENKKSETGKYQLKYEEEGYNPGVAGKNEKNISGKEGVNLRNKLNKKTVKELAEKYGIKVEVIEGMIKILENGKRKGYAYGKYIDQLLTLSEQIKESTAPHELLHAIFDMIDPETKAYLISQVMKSEGWSASKAEERLADSFSNFFRTGKIEGAPKSTWGKIKIFFKRVRSFINGMGKWRNQLEEIFTDIIESEGIEDLQGKIDRNERINKAKERMRERFKQYQKNAQKMQKKAESENKYQRAYHGSLADFDKFDSSHMGEGEGAQAHGWGHYVAVEERTGKHYAEIRPQEYSYKGVKSSDMAKKIIDSKFDGVDYLEGNANAILNKMQDGINFEEAKKQTIENYKDLRDLYEENEQYEDLKKINKEIDFLKNIKESDIAKEKRNLYEVEIPDPVKANTPTGSNYLEEGKKPTRNQYEKFKNELEKYVKNYMPSRIVNLLDVKYEDLNGWGKANVGGGGGALYDIAGTVLGGDKQASKFFESLGYDGIHYFGGRDGEAYVIFNDDALEITNHEKYQKADIDPEATSPENLIEVNDKGLDVMVKFVSEKQKKNALDVSKEILTSDGKPYMWTSTNKYKSKVITDWRNVEDSKYKEYTDKGIQVARFTNNSGMSYSYAGYESKLAPVKKFKSIDELNKFFKENPNNYERILGNGIDDGVLKSSVVYEMKENDGKFELISNSTETLTQSMKDFYDGINNDWFGGNIGEMPENKDEALKKLQEYYNEHDYEIDGERTVKLLKNGNVERTVVKEPTVYKRFDTKLDALAEGYTIAQEADLYHYQGVIQKMKNPLVVDIRSKDNTPSTWSRLGTVNDIFDKEGINYNKEVDYYIRDVEEAMDGFSERMKALEQYWNDAYRDDPYGEVSQFMGNVQLSANNGVTYMVDELEDLLNDPAMGEDLKIGLDTEVYGDLRDYGRTLRDVIIELRNFINTDRNYYALKKLSPEGIESWVKDMGAPKEVVKMIKNKNWKDMLGNWRDIGDKGWRENIKELLTTNGMDLETNDWVRYALDSGKYDGVIFKNIIDYGGLPKEGWENAKGGDVAVTFRSNQFKTWDNEDPTDSKYIRYQRVYHGSPAEFDKFDSSHMGEGEGDQVHGRGHYVAVDPKTGKEYAETLAGPRYKGKEMYELASDLPGYQWNVINHVAEQMRDGVDIENAIANDKKWHEYLLNKAEENLKTEKDEDNIDYLEREIKQQKEMIKIADGLKVSDFETSRGRRNFYEVEIPDIVDADTPTGTNYFEENKVLTRSEIEKILNKLLKRKTQGAERVKNAIDYDLKDGEKIDGRAMVFNLRAGLGNKKASKFLESLGYDGIHYFGGKDGEAYVIFNDDNLEIKNHEKYQKTEYDYDENGNPKRIKFGDNSEFDPSIFGENTREEQIEEDKDNEKSNPFYNAWMRYNNQNYKDDQKTFEEFMKGLSDRADKEQEIYDEKMKSLSDAQNDPKLLELQLKAIKLMEKEQNVGKKFGKNVSKEVRDRQQAEVEKERENLVKEIFDYMYPGLKFEDATYEDNQRAFEKEAEWEMLGKEDIENKLKLYKKDKNGNREAKEIKIENPDIKLEKLLSAGKFDEIFEPTDRVIEWKTPEGQKGRIDKAKDPKKFKSVMEKINSGKTKTKVELKDVTNEVRALERYKENEKAEKERRKKEKQEEFAKKKQEEYKRMVRMKAFQRLVDMQRFEKYPFLTEEEIKNRYGFSDQEWKTITEQEEIKLPKKWGEKAISDFNKAVDDQVKALIEGLNWQNRMKQKEAEKNLGEIGEIDLDVLLGKDEEKGAREVEEFEKLAKEEKKKSKKEKNKRLEQAREDVTQVEIDKERENSKSEKERVDKLIKSTKTDKTVWGAVKKFTADIITPVSTRIKEISPKIYRELMRYFQNKDILTNQRLKEIDPFLKAMAKIRKENPVRFMDIWVALANRNIGYANGLLQEYGVKVPTKLLDTIFDEAEDVGLNINYLGSYYPLSVKAPKSFLEELMKINKGDIASEIEKRIQQESQKKGGPLEESEITAIINSVIAGEEKGPDVNTGNKHLKKRNTEIERTPQMLEYCDDPISTLISYIEGMTQSIERAKFLGKSRSGNVHTLADYVYNAKNGLDPEQQDELMELLKSVFNDESPNKFVQSWRDLATLTTLGSPSSTLTQLSDLSFSVVENGWRETLKAVWDVFASRKVFDLQDMGVLNRGEEYANINSQKNLLQKAIHNVFKLTFFSNFDTFGKSTFIQSTWRKRQKRAKMGENGDKQLRKDIQKWTDDEYTTDKIINDLKKGVFSQDVALLMYMKLGNIQPLTKAQMPKAYLDNPNGRLFYQFKTFGIKQLDYVLQKTKENTKGWKNLSTTEKYLRVAQVANMVFVMTLLGVGADELKDITMRRKSNSMILRRLYGEDVGTEQIWEKMEDNVLKLFGLSRYTVMQMKNDPVDAITSLFTALPATNIVNYPFKDIYKAFKDDGSINWSNPSAYQLIPVVGKYRYWIYGGGQEKQQEALDKENKKKTTTSGGSSRSTRNTRSRSRNTRNSR